LSAKKEREGEEAPFLIPYDVFRECAAHIAPSFRNQHLRKFVFRMIGGQVIFDVKKISERIRLAAKLLSHYPPERILVVSAREYGKTPVLKFCEVTGATPRVGRFPPGTLTNPALPGHVEADIVLVTDPRVDAQAIEEARKMNIPVVAFCSMESPVQNVDLIIPGNTKGRKSLALLYWLLARELLRMRGELSEDEEPSFTWRDFEHREEEFELFEEAAEEVSEVQEE